VSVELSIPKLGVAMTEGELVEWLVADGTTVEAGQAIYILATEKVDNEIEAPVAGTLRTAVDAGETYPVGTVVGTIE
jgi:pyruvate/2-oxoglutarate dehydrogenase complex dihydrolipoamide acyltransferase (E2) component